MGNVFKTTLLMGLLMGLCLVAGEALGGQQGLILAFIFGGVTNVGMYWFSDRVVLAMHGAQEVRPDELPRVHAIVRELAEKAGIPEPKLYVINTTVPNAFATGRNPNHAAVAVNQGILDMLDERELRGVLAHELNHVLHRDILISTVAGVMAGAIVLLARFAMWGAVLGGGSGDRRRGESPLGMLALMIVTPLAASLIQLAISRSCEYHADEGGAQLSGDPMALADALAKIDNSAQRLRGYPAGSPAMAHLYIINPFSMKGIQRLFSTHPPTEERIARLQEMAGVRRYM